MEAFLILINKNMPSNIQTLNELSSVQITNNTIEKIPNYLKKFKEDNSKEIASWINNSKSSSVTEMILASGSGVSYKSNGTNQLFESYSSFILGKTGYQNRWQLNYVKDSSVRDDDFILTYFDGINHFKRFSVEATTGTIKSRSADFRNGNEINCNADYQIALGYSDTAPFNDYSIYRHNFRSSHTVNPALNVENAVDLYLWDATNDKPEAIGSRHVLRWDASGNEELVSGFRIDGGVNFDISTDTTGTIEQGKYAISGKGVLYYNKNSNQYRYSENGSIFKPLGSGGSSGGATVAVETTFLNRCYEYALPVATINPGDPTQFKANGYGVAIYAHKRSRIKSISIATSSSSGILCVAIYKNNSDDAIVTQEQYSPFGSIQAYTRVNMTNHGSKHIKTIDISSFKASYFNNVDVNNLYVNGYFYIAISRTENATGAEGKILVDEVTALGALDSNVSKASFVITDMMKYDQNPNNTEPYQPSSTSYIGANLTTLPYIRIELEEVN